MCIIVYKPKNVILSDNIIENCFDNNSHGAGFMSAVNGKLIIKKGFFTLSSFMEAYGPYGSETVVLHFRIATHGNKDKDNCHPFHVTENLGFAHNGIISGAHVRGSNRSDTQHFCEDILTPLFSEYSDAFQNKTIKHLIKKRIGRGNKLVFLSSDGRVSIYNEEAGISERGCWFSNSSYCRRKIKSSPLVSRHTIGSYYGHNAYSPEHRWIDYKSSQDGKFSNANLLGLGPMPDRDDRDRQEDIKDNVWACDNCGDFVSDDEIVATINFNFCKKCINSDKDNLTTIDPTLEYMLK